MTTNMTTTEIEYTIKIEPEEMAPEDHFEFPEDIKYVYEQMEYNEWAWCQIKVTAEYRGYKGYDYLGACSYKNEEDFKHPDGYYPQMCYQAKENLINNLEDTMQKRLSHLIRKRTQWQQDELIEAIEVYGDLMDSITQEQQP